MVCLPTAGHEREREGAELLLGRGGRGCSRDPHLPPIPETRIPEVPITLASGLGWLVLFHPLPRVVPRQPPEWGGTHGDRALPAAVCVGRGGPRPAPTLATTSPVLTDGEKMGGGVKEGRGEREKDSKIERGGHRPRGELWRGSCSPRPPPPVGAPPYLRSSW